MKTMRIWTSVGVGIAFLAAFLGLQALSMSQVQAKSKSMVGSWEVQINVVEQNSQIPGLLTFSSDGNLLADESPVSPLETSGHGNWVSIGDYESAYTFVFLISDAENNENYLRGTVSGTAEYDVKTDGWSGQFGINIVDQDGNEVLSDTGTMNGTRITAKP